MNGPHFLPLALLATLRAIADDPRIFAAVAVLVWVGWAIGRGL
jgi:hypothetical protein